MVRKLIVAINGDPDYVDGDGYAQMWPEYCSVAEERIFEFIYCMLRPAAAGGGVMWRQRYPGYVCGWN